MISPTEEGEELCPLHDCCKARHTSLIALGEQLGLAIVVVQDGERKVHFRRMMIGGRRGRPYRQDDRKHEGEQYKVSCYLFHPLFLPFFLT